MSDLTPTSDRPRFPLPAEYYEAPVTARPLFPRWVPLGCGIASLVALVIAFLGGAFVMSVGVGKLLSALIDTSHSEMKAMYGPDVPLAKRARVDAAIDQISHDLATDRIAYGKLEPLLTTMRDAMSDKRITNAEADQLLAKSEEVRKPAKKQPAKKARPSPGLKSDKNAPAENVRPSPGPLAVLGGHPLPGGEGTTATQK